MQLETHERSGVERKQLREQQAANDRDTERLPSLSFDTSSERDLPLQYRHSLKRLRAFMPLKSDRCSAGLLFD